MVIIGAGVGGLAAAIGLASRGCEVTVLERAQTPGGKLRQVHVGGVPIDAGPTVLTMRAVFDELFAMAGTTLPAHLRLLHADLLARHAWPDGGRLDLHADVDRSADAIARLAGSAEARRYVAFCTRARQVFDLLDRPFIRSDRPNMPRLLGALPRSPHPFSMAPFTTLWRLLGGYFHDPRLRQLFGRYATYCGSSPFACPSTLMLVAHVEQAGVWLVEGGMHRIATALAGVAAGQGTVFRYGVEARTVLVEGHRAVGVELATGERVGADAVVCNADVAALATGLLGDGVRRAARAPAPGARSLSAVTLAMRATSTGFPLARHNVFFSDAYAAEFDDIFQRGRVPGAPTVYVCAQDRDAVGGLPGTDGAERLFCIVNAPATADTRPLDLSEIAQCQTSTFAAMERCGLHITPSAEPMVMSTPADFHRLFPGTGGALYGAASHGWMASFRRPGVRSKVPGLYLCGGSIHPGPGLPMAALSGTMAATILLGDWASTHRSHPVATPGGMSMA